MFRRRFVHLQNSNSHVKIYYDRPTGSNLQLNTSNLYESLKTLKILKLENFEKIQKLNLNNLQLRGVQCCLNELFQSILESHSKNKQYKSTLERVQFLEKLLELAIEIQESNEEGFRKKEIPEFKIPRDFYHTIGNEVF
jgi:hypothetical protein